VKEELHISCAFSWWTCGSGEERVASWVLCCGCSGDCGRPSIHLPPPYIAHGYRITYESVNIILWNYYDVVLKIKLLVFSWTVDIWSKVDTPPTPFKLCHKYQNCWPFNPVWQISKQPSYLEDLLEIGYELFFLFFFVYEEFDINYSANNLWSF